MEQEDLGKFLDDEGLNLQGFDQWLETQDREEPRDPNAGRKATATNPELLYKLLEGIKGKEEADLIQEELSAGRVYLETSGQLLQVLRYSKGTFRAPGPMIRLGEKIHDHS